MRNEDVAKAFLQRKAAHTRNMWSNGVELGSYSTIIAQWSRNEPNALIVNSTRYSVTTSRHLHYLINLIPSHIRIIPTYPNIRRDTQNLETLI